MSTDNQPALGESAGVSGPIRVLHVDDESTFTELTASFLDQETDRFVVVSEHGVSEALERLDTTTIDCVVSDYDMPRRNGLDLLATVRERWPDLPFILFTGKGSEEIASEAISAGVTDYLQKGGVEQYTVLANRIQIVVGKYRAEENTRRFLRAIETAQEGIGLIDAEGTYRYLNAAYAALYGFEPSELVGRHWEELYPAEEVARFLEEVLPRLEDEGWWTGESVGRHRDGHPIYEALSLGMTDDGGHVCVVTDISESKRREATLERYRTAVEAAPDGFYVMNEACRFELVNRGLAELSGYGRNRLEGAHASVLVNEATLARIRATRERLHEDRDEEKLRDVIIQTADGDEVPCEVRCRGVFEDGAFRGTVGVVRDVSNRT